MGVKCPTCGETLRVRSLMFLLIGDCWNCHKRYSVDVVTGTVTYISDFDEDGNRIEKDKEG